jgi:hypothetical protein
VTAELTKCQTNFPIRVIFNYWHALHTLGKFRSNLTPSFIGHVWISGCNNQTTRRDAMKIGLQILEGRVLFKVLLFLHKENPRP